MILYWPAVGTIWAGGAVIDVISQLAAVMANTTF
jgi:hypothetical protein